MARTETSPAPKEELGVEDIMQRWGCGRAKARMIMDEVGAVRIGRTPFVRKRDLEAYLEEHGAISLNWN